MPNAYKDIDITNQPQTSSFSGFFIGLPNKLLNSLRQLETANFLLNNLDKNNTMATQEFRRGRSLVKGNKGIEKKVVKEQKVQETVTSTHL